MERRRIELSPRMHVLLCEALERVLRQTGDADTRKLLTICRAAKVHACKPDRSAPISPAQSQPLPPRSTARRDDSATTAPTPRTRSAGSTTLATAYAAASHRATPSPIPGVRSALGDELDPGLQQPDDDLEALPIHSMSAAEWNAAVPIGSPVEYYPQGLAGNERSRRTATTSLAWTNTRGVPLVRIKGKPTGVAIAKLQILEADP